MTKPASIAPTRTQPTDDDLCPCCRRPTFIQRGVLMECTNCGFDNLDSCGADGFIPPWE